MAGLKKRTVKKIAKTKKPAKAKKASVKRVVRKIKKPIVKKIKYPVIIKKFAGNPIMEPHPGSTWQSMAVFNPAAVLFEGRIHLFYRALGYDGVSRIGHASSQDGIHFDERSSFPVYEAENFEEASRHHPFTSPARLTYNTGLYASGGGWGGCEDPRAVRLNNKIYLTFNMFNGWESMRVAFTSLGENDLTHRHWSWQPLTFLSKLGDRQKNWVLFPEKFNGKFAVLHNIDMGNPARVGITFMDKLDSSVAPSGKEAPDPQQLPDHLVAWHHRTRSAAAPPIKTADGWLLFYHAMDKNDPNRYKVGAMLLDLNDPTKVLYRSSFPVLEPDEWYENDWKPGIVYASGAVVKGDTLFLYYGGGDKRVAVAYANLREFIQKLKNKEHAVFAKKLALKI